MTFKRSRSLVAIGAVLAFGICGVVSAAPVSGDSPVNGFAVATDVHSGSVALGGECSGASITFSGQQLLECKDGKWAGIKSSDLTTPNLAAAPQPAMEPHDSRVVALTINVKTESSAKGLGVFGAAPSTSRISVPMYIGNGRHGYVEDGTVTNYVSSVQPCKDDAKKICLETSDLKSGLRVEAAPRVLPTGDIFLDIGVQNSVLESLRNFSSDIGTVQLPDVSHCGFSASVALTPGVETLVNTCNQAGRNEQVFVTATVEDLKASAH
jgi:hypothetical protein